MKNRILFIDYARTIALFLVVFAHMYSYDSKEKLYIYAFHMPFFYIVSGMLYKEIPFVDLIKKMTKRVLIPFFSFLLISYFFFAILSRSFATSVIIGSIKGIITGDFITANHVLWFFISLFLVRVIGDCLIKKTVIYLPLFLITFFVCVLFHVNNFYIGTSIMAIPFFLFGYYARNLIKKIVLWHYGFLLSFVLLILSILITNVNGRVSMMGFSFGQAGNVPVDIAFFYINGVVGSLMLMCIVGG